MRIQGQIVITILQDANDKYWVEVRDLPRDMKLLGTTADWPPVLRVMHGDHGANQKWYGFAEHVNKVLHGIFDRVMA